MQLIKSNSLNDAFTKIISKKEESPSLEEAKKFLGGNIEFVEIMNPEAISEFQLLVNEEAEKLKLSVNEVATQAAGQLVYGNAIMLLGEALWE